MNLTFAQATFYASEKDGKKKRKLAKHFRNNMTLPEVLLWNQIKWCQIGFDFNRQFCLGPYIADFYCRKVRLVVEVDGLVHQLKTKADAERDAWLKAHGVHVLRVTAKSVLRNPHAVSQYIRAHILELMTSRTMRYLFLKERSVRYEPGE
jgi:very-short-patch-repair endonuclease